MELERLYFKEEFRDEDMYVNSVLIILKEKMIKATKTDLKFQKHINYGWPMHNRNIPSDINEYWEYGHDLFRRNN